MGGTTHLCRWYCPFLGERGTGTGNGKRETGNGERGTVNAEREGIALFEIPDA